MKFNHFEPLQVIEPEIYRKQSTLREDIQILCNPDILVTDDMVINIVTKYFYAYRYPQSVDKKIDLKEIETLFGIGAFFYELSKIKNATRIPIGNAELVKELEYFKEHMYGLGMLGDLASTSKIFSQIVREKLEIPDNHKYLGIDLGSGSGIMLLAQKIQARRNGFIEKNITNVGVEIQRTQAQKAHELATILNFGGVIYGDSTKKETFDGIENKHISYITNETIPNPRIPMTGENDPFFQNFENIYTHYEKSITENTGIFPKNLLVNFAVDTSDGKPIFSQEVIVNKKNNYLIDFFNNIEQQMIHDKNFNHPEGRRVYNQIQPIGITLGDKIFHALESVGEDLITSFTVKKLHTNYFKRWKNVKKEETENTTLC